MLAGTQLNIYRADMTDGGLQIYKAALESIRDKANSALQQIKDNKLGTEFVRGEDWESWARYDSIEEMEAWQQKQRDGRVRSSRTLAAQPLKIPPAAR